QMHPPLDEGAREVSEESSEGEDRGGPEGFGDRRSEGPARRGREDEKRCGEEEPHDGAPGGPADEASPGLAVAEQALAVAQGPSEADRPAAAEEDGRRIRDEGGGEEPQGRGDRLEGRRADVVFPPRTSTRLPLVVPEVQVLVPVDPTHPQATADAHGNRLVLPLFRGRSQVPMNLPVGSANPSQGFRFRI